LKINDAVMGALLLVLAAAIGIYVSSFPGMSGQRYGAALFPGMIAAGLAACGVLLLARGVREKAPAVEFAPWTREPALAANFALICGALLFYVYASEPLGFMPTGTLLLLALFLKLGVRPLRAAVVAPVAVLVIHLLFYKLLKVPLPWGVLGFMAGW
jgi:putative tricarboxylic transport membrane protein